MTKHPRAVVIIHEQALRHNYAYIRSTIKPDTKMCAMVKADAYGHGLVGVAKILADCGIHYFGVAAMSEALEIRSNGMNTPVLMMGYTAEEDIHLLWEKDLTQTIYSLEQAKLLNSCAEKPIKCHLKLDTGMSRLGFLCEGGLAGQDLLEVLTLKNLTFEGVFTHFSNSDEPENPKTKQQFQLFMNILADLQAKGYTFPIRHVSNSGAVMNFPEMNLDMVRCGLELYGMSPDAQQNPNLIPVLEFAGTVEAVKTIKAGQAISYGSCYVCEKDTKIAVISLGYADGVSRCFSRCGCLLINGHRAPIVGKICMDHLMVDVSDISDLKILTPAYLIGGGPNGVTADELAKLEDTISYEILCRFVGSRVEKRVVD